MSSSSFNPDDAAGQVPSQPRQAEREKPEGSLLEKVLQETLLGGEGSPDEPLLAALGEVARRHKGQPLSLDPVLVDLIEAIVRINLGQSAVKDAQLGLMPRQIAETLWNDLPSRDRLERFWTRLGEAAR
jgi:hypothetical protein